MSHEKQGRVPDQAERQGKTSAAGVAASSRHAKGPPVRARDKDQTAKDLRFALKSLKEAGLKVSVVAVAEAVGVHPSTVHHVYPELAKEISSLRGRSATTKRERGEDALVQALKALEELRVRFKEAEQSVKTLASRNATLDARVRILEELQATSKVVTRLKPTTLLRSDPK